MKVLLKVFIGLLLFILFAGVVFYTPDKSSEQLIEKYKYPTSTFLKVADQEVHVRIEGQGPALVCVHGFGGNLRNWDAWTEELSDEFTVISYDLPGYGLTGPTAAGDYSDTIQVTYLKSLIERLSIDTFALAGNSMGGAIAWQYALRYPSDVSELILVDPSGYRSVRDDLSQPQTPLGFKMLRISWLKNIMSNITPKFVVKQTLQDSYGNPDVITAEEVQVVHDLMRFPGNRSALFERMSIEQFPPFEDISNISIPTMIMWGDQDKVIPVSHAYEFEERIPMDTLIVYEGIGHLPMDEIGKRSAEDVRLFLQK